MHYHTTELKNALNFRLLDSCLIAYMHLKQSYQNFNGLEFLLNSYNLIVYIYDFITKAFKKVICNKNS